jgi:hypothetical protein
MLFSWQVMFAQSRTSAYKKSTLQLGLFPGMSTNGLNPGEYDNSFSFNLISGYGHSTRRLEINGLSGFNTASSSGIHISGLANYIGVNGMVGLNEREKRVQRRKGYETNLSGFQFSGLLNYVGTNVFGAQVTLGVNNVANHLMGVQLSGLFNYVDGFTIGTQISGLGNYSKKSMSGVQISLLFNATQGSYSGIQLGAFNHAGVILPTKGPFAAKNTALQIGLINHTTDMGGWQIGLVNVANKVSGTQIGLINIFKNENFVDYKDGPAYGLLNFGGIFNPRIYYSDLFLANYGLYTGKALNSRVRSAGRSFYSYNEIVYSSNHGQLEDYAWGASYRFGLISFYKAIDITNQRNYYSISGELGHINLDKKLDKSPNMRYAVNAEIGLRLSRKLGWIYPFLTATYNYMPNGTLKSTEFLASSIGKGQLWPGFSAGVMIH